jgi:ABC-2 type transport system permease protein
MSTAILSGEIAPLVFFPPSIAAAAQILPFQFLAYTPVQIFLEKITGASIITAFLSALVWCAALIALTLFMWCRGLHRYEGSGL